MRDSEFSFSWSDACLCVCHETPDREVYDRLISTLRRRGFFMRLDESVSRSIRKDFHRGCWRDLMVKCRRAPRLDTWDFYQMVNFENPNGGEYDFNREAKMPYQIGLRYRLIRNLLSDALDSFGYVDATKPIPRTAFDFIAYKRANHMGWGRPYDRENRSRDAYNFTSANDERLKDGIRVYFVRNGHKQTGIAYHNCNNMWWVISNANSRPRNIPNFDLVTRFDHISKLEKWQLETAAKRQKQVLNGLVKHHEYERAARLRDAMGIVPGTSS